MAKLLYVMILEYYLLYNTNYITFVVLPINYKIYENRSSTSADFALQSQQKHIQATELRIIAIFKPVKK